MKPRHLSGVALVVVVVGAGAFFYFWFLPRVLDHQGGSAKMDIMHIEKAVLTYQTKHNRWPPDLKTLTEKEDGGSALLTESSLSDPWGRPYHYDPDQKHSKTGYPLIWSDGPKPGESGSKIANWTD